MGLFRLPGVGWQQISSHRSGVGCIRILVTATLPSSFQRLPRHSGGSRNLAALDSGLRRNDGDDAKEYSTLSSSEMT